MPLLSFAGKTISNVVLQKFMQCVIYRSKQSSCRQIGTLWLSCDVTVIITQFTLSMTPPQWPQCLPIIRARPLMKFPCRWFHSVLPSDVTAQELPCHNLLFIRESIRITKHLMLSCNLYGFLYGCVACIRNRFRKVAIDVYIQTKCLWIDRDNIYHWLNRFPQKLR